MISVGITVVSAAPPMYGNVGGLSVQSVPPPPRKNVTCSGTLSGTGSRRLSRSAGSSAPGVRVGVVEFERLVGRVDRIGVPAGGSCVAGAGLCVAGVGLRVAIVVLSVGAS